MHKEEVRYPNNKEQICPKEVDSPNQQEVVQGRCPAPSLCTLFVSLLSSEGVERMKGKGGKGRRKNPKVAKDKLQAVCVTSLHSGISPL